MCIDGSDMRGGDGVFINSSCSPNTMLHPCYIFHDDDVLLPDRSNKLQPAKLRNIILVFRPLRYVRITHLSAFISSVIFVRMRK